MENISQMSMLEVACMLMEQKRTAQAIRKIIKEVLEIKGIDDEDQFFSTQLYIDITTSSKFVYMGNEEWDLKSRQSLDEYDKDGSAFNSKEDFIEEEPEIAAVIPVDNFEDEEEYFDDEYEDYLDEEDVELNTDEEDEVIKDKDAVDNSEEEFEEPDNDDYMDEGKYNDYMDDYEDMYDEE